MNYRAFIMWVMLGLISGTAAGSPGDTRCKYCDAASYGRGCPYSPYKIHEHLDTDPRCVFCGSSSYGNGCPYSQTKKHEHGNGGNKCIYCGSRSLGRGCPYSPYQVHER